MNDTITISRDLFERLCESAIVVNEYHLWVESTCGVMEQECRWLKLKNEALAIRDGAKG